ncbi:hypothetical protein ILUMI_02753 [Ignelater luminosus]|uniref:Mos1 transposase HTH domain-containing protein n=1 Tax=Ignelater luminosus TaxID=2038154 RepID=A0A8K0DHR6_IGNLU|nr:hypothetical protein ILUMI_02753 [Ignelater luminosus]
MSEFPRRDFRAVMCYNFKRGLCAKDCFAEMKDVFGDSSPSQATIKRNYANFCRGDFDLNDDSRSGRVATAVTEENMRGVKELVTDNSHITYVKIEETLGIHAASVHSILHEHLGLRKVCTELKLQITPQDLEDTASFLVKTTSNKNFC